MGWGFTETAEELIIIMELCPGDMRVFFRSPAPLPAKLVIDWLKQISSGMWYLHDTMHIFHGDLKPGLQSCFLASFDWPKEKQSAILNAKQDRNSALSPKTS